MSTNFDKVFNVLQNNTSGYSLLEELVPSESCFTDSSLMRTFLTEELGDRFDSVMSQCNEWIDKFNNKEAFELSFYNEVQVEYKFFGVTLEENIDHEGYVPIDIGDMISSIIYAEIEEYQ